jgi:DNA-binding SARP family transcriptional activator
VLGPLLVEDENGPVDVRGPRHRAVLARLLIAQGRVVPLDRLIDDLWPEPPDGAAGTIQTFVAALRRALEPGRAPRSPARLLVTTPPGYALRVSPDRVDARRFELAVTEAGLLLQGDSGSARIGQALARLDDGLGAWRGPAYAEFAEADWARAEVSRLEELQLLGRERRAEALVRLGRAAEAVLALEIQVQDQPWREDGWRWLALALYRAGRQGDALGALRRARAVLVEQLGVDPGPGLRRLEADILDQAEHLSPDLTPERASIEAVAGLGGTAQDTAAALVGREDEIARLVAVATAVEQRRRLGLVLVSGEAGAGKTALALAFTTVLAGRGWTTGWGGSPEHEGAPAAWAWSRLLDEVRTASGVPSPSTAAADVRNATGARFEWHRSVGAYLGRVARQSPLLLVLDDLHWAGEETLALLTSLITEPPAEPVLVIATYRITDVSAGLAALLARVARAEPDRIYLGGLPVAAVSELLHGTIGAPADPATVRIIHRRSSGNPFFVRELARLFEAEGAAGLAAVPPGVRDVVRYRVSTLTADQQAVLQQAAVIGIDVDLELLTALAPDPEPVLDAVEAATRHGFLVEHGPQRFRFAHALVRDTVYEDLSRSRRAQWHERLALKMERLRPDDVEALAHHFVHSENPASADRTIHYTRAAAELAEQRWAPHQAARLWRAALTAHQGRNDLEDLGADELPVRLELIMGLVRALAVTGSLDQARQYRSTAITLAEQLDDPVRTARVIGAFDVPALWTNTDDPELADRIVEVTERTLAALPAGRVADRSRLLATLAVELRNTGGDRARRAAREAEALARELNDPALLGFALNARFMQSFERAGLAPERARIGIELLSLATTPALVSLRVLGHLILVQSYSSIADFASADEQAAAVDQLGEDHGLPLVSVFTRWYRALRASVIETPDSAATEYRTAAARLTGTGMTGLGPGILPLALLCLQLRQARSPDVDPGTDFGEYEAWCRPVLLLAAGQLDRARVLAAEIPDSPRDLLYEARTALHALIAIELDDRPTMARLYRELLPAAAELAGAGSGLLTLGPVAQYLGDLATALGRPDQAATHYLAAGRIASLAGTP